MCQGFSHVSAFLHHFVSAKLATSSIRVNVISECGSSMGVINVNYGLECCMLSLASRNGVMT